MTGQNNLGCSALALSIHGMSLTVAKVLASREQFFSRLGHSTSLPLPPLALNNPLAWAQVILAHQRNTQVCWSGAGMLRLIM